MPAEKSNVYFIILIILSASLGITFIISTVLVIDTRREIREEHEFLDENFLSHTESQNRLIFNIYRLLTYDKTNQSAQIILKNKTNLCLSIINSVKYIQKLPEFFPGDFLGNDPLLLEDRLEEQNLQFKMVFSKFERSYTSLEGAVSVEAAFRLIAEFEDTGKEMMHLLEAQNHLLGQFDDYVFSHLQNDLKEITSILSSLILLHSALTFILVIVSSLYILFSRKTSRLLKRSKKQLEEIVKDRTLDLMIKHEELEIALKEKEYLLKEVHHRVKNSLALINSMINLKMGDVDDPKIQTLLEDISNKIYSITLVHQKIYQSSSLSRIDFREYAEDLSKSIINSVSYQNVELKFSMCSLEIEPELIIPLGIIISELVTNAVKYGFSGRSDGIITLKLSNLGNIMELTIHNNGNPFPGNVDFRSSPSLGLKIVCALIDQIGGAIELIKNNGTLFTIRFQDHNSIQQ